MTERVRIKPEDFIEIFQVCVMFQGMALMCQRIDDVAWRCGKCGRGVLIADDEICKVCHSLANFHKSINWERFREAEKQIAEMEFRRTNA